MLHNSLLKCQAVHVQDNGTSCSTHETVLKNVFIHFEVGKAGTVGAVLSASHVLTTSLY